MTKTRLFIVGAAVAALIACSKDADDKAGAGSGGSGGAAATTGTNTWQIDDFAITVTPPDGWVLWEVDGDFGKVVFARTDGGFADSKLTVTGTCGGSCQAAAFQDNIAKAAEERFGSVEGGAWDKQLTEIKPGVWAYRFRGKSMGKDTVKVYVDHIVEGVDDQYIECIGELVGEDAGKADAIETLCTELSYETKDSGKPVEAPLGGKYAFEDFALDLPTPPDWKFASYSVQWGKVTFKREGFGTQLVLGETCGGRCKEEQFPANIEEEATNDFESMGRDAEATWVEEFSEVEPGIYMHRIRATKDGAVDGELIKVAATRKGADHYFYCRAELSKDDVGLADQMQTFCLERTKAAAK